VIYADAVLAFIKTGNKKDADIIIAKMKALAIKIEDGGISLISALRKVADYEGDTDHIFGLTERLLYLQPSDTDARFTLAYKYSQANQDDVSLFHYLRIPFQERSAATWNNLGVEFDHFDLPGKSVEAYRKAEELDETLAMSNLAYKLINAGFLYEAEELCKKAMNIKAYHKNVSHTISRIKDIPEEETKKEKEIVDKAKPLCEFYKEFGDTLLKADAPAHDGQWQGPKCKLRVTIDGNQFKAEGSYEQPTSILELMAHGMSPSSMLPKKAQYRIRYEGNVTGRTVKCTMTREKVGEPVTMSGLLGGPIKELDVLMILSEPLTEIKVYEKREGKERTFYSITRIE